ncbi:hypothetical protein SteCoe_6100 [Stentor coeruleus]|uniref:Vacuolar-sorting protein SNF8 n=1 Tax=Stentor coeruleus TaxID=5963 RepID=A0A1R2CQY8_9CILI|nr:hypothetical protein SteCoe_6100 [Stentor coeruleus]
MKALMEQKRMKELYKKKGSEMEGEFKKNLKSQLQQFHQSLESFITNNRAEINKNPNLRQEFYDLCREIGLDPLISSKGACSDARESDENTQYYNDIAVQATTVCLGLKNRTGGLLSIEDCWKWVNKLRGQRHSVPLSDLYRAIDNLKVLGNGMTIIEGESKMILSVPMELNLDQRGIIEAAKGTGFVSYDMFHQWNKTRFDKAVESLISEGMVWVDALPNGKIQYWFPAQSLMSS